MYTIGSIITIGKVDYIIIGISEVKDEKFLIQDGITHILAIQDGHENNYSVKAYGLGGFSHPKRIKL